MIAAAALLAAMAAASPAPEECIVGPGRTAAASATFDGKTYTFTTPECRDAFLADPERYSQLYDALAELIATGAAVEPSDDEASLVPS